MHGTVPNVPRHVGIEAYETLADSLGRETPKGERTRGFCCAMSIAEHKLCNEPIEKEITGWGLRQTRPLAAYVQLNCGNWAILPVIGCFEVSCEYGAVPKFRKTCLSN